MLSFTFSLHDQISVVGIPLSISDPVTAELHAVVQGQPCDIHDSYDTGPGSRASCTDMTISAYVGETITWSTTIDATAFALSNALPFQDNTIWESMTATSDASNTSYTAISFSDPGVYLITASGYNYPTTIPQEGDATSLPEPAAAALLGVAIAAPQIVRRRRTA